MDRKPLRVDDDLIVEINPLKSPQQRRYELAKQEDLNEKDSN
jgi:cell division protein FtsL